MTDILTSIHGRRLGLDADDNLVVKGGIEKLDDTPVAIYPKLPTYTVATAPSAATAGAGALIYLSDGNGGAASFAFSNGTNWIDIDGSTAAGA